MHTRNFNRFLFAAATTLSLMFVTPPAQAETTTEPDVQDAEVSADIEIDPIAYAFDGFSLHAGIAYKRLRIDLGAYAMSLPGFLNDQDAFDVSFNGYGVKVQYFVFEEQTGGFVGLGTGVSNVLVKRVGTQLADTHTQFSAGANLGWRFDLVGGFYATPWVGFDYTFNPKDVTLAGETFESNPFMIFPTVHLGYRF